MWTWNSDPFNDCLNKAETCKLLRKHHFDVASAWGETDRLRKSGAWNNPLYRPIENFLYAAAYSDGTGIGVIVNQYLIEPFAWVAGQSSFRSNCAALAGLSGVEHQSWTTKQWKDWCGDCSK